MPPDQSAGSGTISIALCTYNGSRFLPAQLASYLNQDRMPHELVVGDDGSTDETRSMIEQFARTAPFPVHFHSNPERLGVGRNFDETIQRCSGEFIALSDQDDEWRPDKLACLAGLLERHTSAGYACSDATLIDESSESLSSHLWEQYRCPPGQFLQSDSLAAGRHLLFESDRVLGATMMLRSASLRLLHPIPTSWLHDHWYSVMCELIDAHGVSSSEELTRYRLHGEQTCGLRRPVGKYRPKKREFARRQTDRIRRRERLIELRKHLVEQVIPVQPRLTHWLSVLDEADRIAEEAIIRDCQPWWQRKLDRLKRWWSAARTSGIRRHHGLDQT
jgi:glycosyltransferase involved in cell wall biosynthesis